MTRIRIATFNAENLFARFQFKGKRVKYRRGGKTKYKYVPYTPSELKETTKEGWRVNDTRFDIYKAKERKITAQAIKALKADVVCLQEVENMDVLKRFNAQFLSSLKYRYKLVIDGNDPRLIDVAILSKYPFAKIKTHQFEKSNNKRSYVFSRDCLEVDLQIGKNKTLPVFINHFKSLVGGRDNTMERRKEQTKHVAKIIKKRFKNPEKHNFVILGDFNDYLPSAGLKPLLGQPWAENIIERLPEENQWTHYWNGGNSYSQLDYILLSSKLAKKNKTVLPEIERRGMPKRATHFTGKRFKGVGHNHPKASDHCPVVVGVRL